MTLELTIDLALATLLIAVLCSAFVLNRKLGALRSTERQLTAMLESFKEATERAESGVYRLKLAADQAERTISNRIAQAQAAAARLEDSTAADSGRQQTGHADDDRAALRLVQALRSVR